MSDSSVFTAPNGPEMKTLDLDQERQAQPKAQPRTVGYSNGSWRWDFGDHNHLNKPDAIDDSGTTPEDNSVRLELLGNDDDADAWDGLRVLSATDPAHGVAVLSADGQAVLYTPDRDYSGTDSFTYTVRNLKGDDTATVTLTVKAVADAPTLAVEVLKNATDPANVVSLRLTAATTDTDESEYIDRFEFAGLPSGASVSDAANGVIDESGTPGMVTRDIKLVLPLNQDADFDLSVSAVSKEPSSGSEARTTAATGIVLDANVTQFDLTFEAQDQSIWSTGDEFTFEDNRFLGVDFTDSASTGGLVFASIEASLKAGLQSDLTFRGGRIDATLPYDVTVSTNYNRTTDTLLLTPLASLGAGATFQTVGPQGSYKLDFIFDYSLKPSIGLDLDFGGPFGIFDFGKPTLPLPELSADYAEELLNLDSSGLSESIAFPFGISATLAWPNVATTGTISAPDTLSSDGASNNFLQLGMDVDQALADIFLGGANPFDIQVDIGVANANVELVDFDIAGGLNFVEAFDLQILGLSGVMQFENGTTQDISTGSDLTIPNASSLDLNEDGAIEFGLTLALNTTLRNDTKLGFNVGYDLEILKASGSYGVGPFSDTFSLGPLINPQGTATVLTVPVFEDTFPLSFASENASFVV